MTCFPEPYHAESPRDRLRLCRSCLYYRCGRSEEFLVRLLDGSELTARDYRSLGKPRVWTERETQSETKHANGLVTLAHFPGLAKNTPAQSPEDGRLRSG